MSDELWNEKLTRENLKDFYMSTVDMVYSSVFEITQEPTRCERAIVKSYLDIYAKRANVPGERVIYDFGDILRLPEAVFHILTYAVGRTAAVCVVAVV